jgi:hypothetical protein
MRDIKNCEDHGNQEVRRYGKALREKASLFIDVYKAYSEEERRDAKKQLLGRMLELKQEIITVATTDVPQVPSKARGIAKRFLDHPESYFTFLTKSGVEITSNNAERELRPIVLQRLINQQTRSLDGDREKETLTSIYSTLKKTKQDSLKFMVEALTAHSEGRALPSLVNIGQTVDPKYVEMAIQERKDLEKRKAEEKETASKESETKQNPATPKDTLNLSKEPEGKQSPVTPEETVDKVKGPETKEDPAAPEETVDKAKGPETKEDPFTPVETEAKDKEPETREDPVTPVKTEAKDEEPETKHQSAIAKEAEAKDKEPQSKQSPDIPKKTEDRSKIPKETKSKQNSVILKKPEDKTKISKNPDLQQNINNTKGVCDKGKPNEVSSKDGSSKDCLKPNSIGVNTPGLSLTPPKTQWNCAKFRGKAFNSKGTASS